MPPSTTAETRSFGGRWDLLALVGGIVPGVALRVLRLGRWPLAGDELGTLRDSVSFHWNNPRPLVYALNHYLVMPVIGLDELSLRLVPVLFGIATIPALYLLGRRVVGARGAAFATLLIAFSPWHVYASQYARYYSLVAFFATVFPLAAWIAFRQGRPLWWVTAGAASILAILSHPASAAAVVGACAWVAWAGLRSRRVALRSLVEQIPRMWLVIGGIVAVTGGVLIGVRLTEILVGWVRLGEEWGHGPVGLAMSYAAWVTPAALIMAAAEVILLWREGRRELAGLLLAVVAFPLVSLALATLAVSISTSYLYATLPMVFVGAGAFIGRVGGLARGRVPRLVVWATLVIAVLAAGSNTLASQYLDGDRPDFRAAARFLREHAASTDVVLADQRGAVRHYLRNREFLPFLRSDAQLDSVARAVAARPGSSRVWLVVQVLARGGFNEQSLGAVAGRVTLACRVEFSDGVPRLDFRQNRVDVYSCSPRALASLSEGVRIQGTDISLASPLADGRSSAAVGAGSPLERASNAALPK